MRPSLNPASAPSNSSSAPLRRVSANLGEPTVRSPVPPVSEHPFGMPGSRPTSSGHASPSVSSTSASVSDEQAELPQAIDRLPPRSNIVHMTREKAEAFDIAMAAAAGALPRPIGFEWGGDMPEPRTAGSGGSSAPTELISHLIAQCEGQPDGLASVDLTSFHLTAEDRLRVHLGVLRRSQSDGAVDLSDSGLTSPEHIREFMRQAASKWPLACLFSVSYFESLSASDRAEIALQIADKEPVKTLQYLASLDIADATIRSVIFARCYRGLLEDHALDAEEKADLVQASVDAAFEHDPTLPSFQSLTEAIPFRHPFVAEFLDNAHDLDKLQLPNPPAHFAHQMAFRLQETKGSDAASARLFTAETLSALLNHRHPSNRQAIGDLTVELLRDSTPAHLDTISRVRAALTSRDAKIFAPVIAALELRGVSSSAQLAKLSELINHRECKQSTRRDAVMAGLLALAQSGHDEVATAVRKKLLDLLVPDRVTAHAVQLFANTVRMLTGILRLLEAETNGLVSGGDVAAFVATEVGTAHSMAELKKAYAKTAFKLAGSLREARFEADYQKLLSYNRSIGDDTVLIDHLVNITLRPTGPDFSPRQKEVTMAAGRDCIDAILSASGAAKHIVGMKGDAKRSKHIRVARAIDWKVADEFLKAKRERALPDSDWCIRIKRDFESILRFGANYGHCLDPHDGSYMECSLGHATQGKIILIECDSPKGVPHSGSFMWLGVAEGGPESRTSASQPGQQLALYLGLNSQKEGAPANAKAELLKFAQEMAADWKLDLLVRNENNAISPEDSYMRFGRFVPYDKMLKFYPDSAALEHVPHAERRIIPGAQDSERGFTFCDTMRVLPLNPSASPDASASKA